MAIEAGSSTYYQAKRGIPSDNLVFYIDPSIKDSYRNIGDDKIYSLVNPSHYMNVNTNMDFKRGRQNSGLEHTVNNVSGAMWTSSASSYGMSMDDCTYIFYEKCKRGLNGAYGSFDDWIFQAGSYYGNNSFGFGLYGWSLSLFAKASQGGGWTWSSSNSSAATFYNNNRNNWVFYVVRFDGNNSFKVYFNNGLYFNAANITYPFTGIHSNVVRLGRYVQPTIGLFAVYDTALSDDKISDFYNATRHRFGV